MAELIKVNKKVINDPLYTPVIKFLKDRIAALEETGPADELALSKQRYDGLVAGDLIIESAVTFPDNVVRVCIVSRKTGFARVDIDIKYVQMDDILTDFAVPMVEIEDVDHLKTYVKENQDIEPTLLFLKYKQTYGVLLTQSQATTHEGPMAAFGDLFFENFVTERDSLNSIDWETLESGTVTITDPSFGRGVYPLFVYELVLSEAQLPEITSNLPLSISTHRGEAFQIPNTYWFAGNQDITLTATVELSTKSGYAILERSSDKLEIEGTTIYGSATQVVNDQIVVRVTYDWAGRLVRKNFYVAMEIQKDVVNDLTLVTVPTDVTCTSGDLIEVSVTANYKGDVVEILIPPTLLRSQRNFGDLTYIRTKSDNTMIYRGTVTGDVSGNQDQVTDLWSATFNYNNNGTNVSAIGYVSFTIVRKEVRPTFSVTGVPTMLTGYLGTMGSYTPVIKYGDEDIPLTEVGLTTGVQGSKGLIDITNVTNAAVSWKIVADSGIPGVATIDNFQQRYEWLDPYGVLQNFTFTIQVLSKVDSIVEIVPVAPQPRNVNRYQFGGPTFTLMVNGVAANNLINSLTVSTVHEGPIQYIINAANRPNNWFVVQADETQDTTYTANFIISARIDGENKIYNYPQEFIIAQYVQGTPEVPDVPVVTPPVDDGDPTNPGGEPAPGEEGTGPGGNTGPVKPIDPDNPDAGYETDPSGPGGVDNPNSPGTTDDPSDPNSANGPYNYDITAVPVSFTIGGDSDKNYTLAFKVFQGITDVTANSEIMPDYTVLPDFVDFNSIDYNAQANQFVVNYTKHKGGVSTGAVFAKLKATANPTKKQIARLYVNVNVKQIKILKVIDAPHSVTMNVEQPQTLPLSVEFSGNAITLNDPNLAITLNGDTSAVIQEVNETNLVFINNDWNGVGTTITDITSVTLAYTDPADGKVYTFNMPLNINTVFPDMEVVYTASQDIAAKIWDTGVFPVKLVAGTKDWTDTITAVSIITGDKYLTVNKLNWSIIFAEPTIKSQIVGLRIYFTVGTVSNSLPADFKFTLAAWDGITFTSDAHTPSLIQGTAEETGEITASFIYKAVNATDSVSFNKAASTIPDNIILGTGSYDAGRDLFVIPYTLTNGGVDTLELVFSAPDNSNVTTTISIGTNVTWLDQMNIVNAGANIRGFWEDTVTFPLSINVAGVPIDLNDPNMAVVFDSGDGDPLALQEILETGLSVLLAQGGTLGTTYDYTVDIGLTYTNQSTGKVYNKSLSIPASIRVSAIRVGANPIINASVYQHGVIPITLLDERNNVIPIQSYVLTGPGVNVTLVNTNEWYVTNGLTSGPTTGQLPLRLGYSFGGSNYTIDVTESFNISQWDGISYTARTSVTSLTGNGGDAGVIPFTFTYQGYPAQDSTLDLTRSTIPNNINIGELVNGNLSYTLAGQADLDMILYLVRPNPSTPQVAGRDYAVVTLPVSTTSSNLPFTLVSNDSSIALDWGKSGVINVSLKYGDNAVPANTPGLRFTLADADVHGITITGTTTAGITVKATRSDVAGSTKIYPETINVSYEVGAPEPKTVSFDTSATVSMGPVALQQNGQTNVAIWNTGTFRQQISFNGIVLPGIDHFELQSGTTSKYIEIKSPTGYEIIGAEPTTSVQSIPLTMFYRVDGTDVLQQLNFNAPFQITGSTSVRFKVTATPTDLQGSLDNEVTLTCTPIYKDVLVGINATFKPDLSTIPSELTLKDYKVVGNNYVITFIGASAGIDTMELVFWSPDAGTNPAPRDVATVTVNVTVMGELGLEIGTRSNLLTGKNADTGSYNLQILFGGIPIDTQASIADGSLTAVVEVGAASSNNANVLSVVSWASQSFNYRLAGCVVPNATANVSDFINLTYRYGATNYTARVEIPLAYTSSKPVFNYNLPASVSVYDTGTIIPTITCDGVNISSGFSSIQNTDSDAYVTWSAKTYSIIYAEPTDITHAVPSRVIGQYRNWAWAVNDDVTFNIAAWNQKVYFPLTAPTSWEAFQDLTGTVTSLVNLSATYKEAAVNVGNSSLLDLSRSDLKGLISLTYTTTYNILNQRYTAQALKAGTETINMCWLRPGAPTPGVIDADFGFTTMDVNIKQNSLIGASSGHGAGGEGDTAVINLVVRLLSTNTQIVNNNANLVIQPVNENIFKIISMTASQITVQVTAPYTTEPGEYTVPLTFTYTDPTTQFVTTGTFDAPITIKRPADYPVATYTGNVNRYLWDYGPNPFTIKSGSTDITTQAVPLTCVDDAISPDGGSGYMQLSYNQPVNGTWWWVTSTFTTTGTQGRTTTWTMQVPYRNTTVIITGSFNYSLNGTLNSQDPFKGTVGSAKILIQTVGEQAEIPFQLLWRNYKYGSAVFKPDASGVGSFNFNDYFKVIGQRYDDTTGTTYLTIEMTAMYQGSMNFVWDLPGTTIPVVGTNRVSILVNMYGLTITPTASQQWTMWQTRTLSSIVSIKDGTTELVATSKVVGFSDPLWVNINGATTANPSIQLKSAVAVPAKSINLVYQVQLPASYNNRIIEISIPTTTVDYNGDELTWSLTSFSNTPKPAESGQALTFYYGLSFRGVTVVVGNQTTTLALFKSINNNNNLTGATIARISGSGWIGYTFGTTSQYLGDLKLPINIIGLDGVTDYPAGTLGKNYIEIPVTDLTFYENTLYVYPNQELASVNATYPTLLTAPVKFSVGADVSKTIMNANAGPTWTLDNAAALSKTITKNGANATGLTFNVLWNNLGADVEVDAQITATYTGTMNSVALTKKSVSFVQKIIMKGTGAGDTVTATITPYSGKVWDVGGPSITITQNGTVIPTSAITNIIIANNPYVRRPETNPGLTTRWWEIYNGVPAGNTVNVSITVQYTDGPVTKSYTGVVPFTIAAYDGIDMVINPTSVTAVINSQGNLIFSGKYRGVQIPTSQLGSTGPTGIGIWQSKTIKLPSVISLSLTSVNNTDSTVLYTLRSNNIDMMVSENMKVYFGLLGKENDPTAVEGKDYVIINVPTYVYTALKFYPVIYPDPISGRYSDGTQSGTKYRASMTVRQGITPVSLKTTNFNLFITPANVITTNDSNMSSNYIDFWFINELTTAPTKVTDVVISHGLTTTIDANRAHFPIKVTQISNLVFPTVSGLADVTAELNKSGGLPFTLLDDTGVDITSQATITGISTNDYINLKDGKWYCYNTRTGDTTLQVNITYQITYKGVVLNPVQTVNFIVKAFTGQPTVSNVQIISGKLGDAGTSLPFNINVNGVVIPSSWITNVAGVAANGRISVGSTPATAWTIIQDVPGTTASDTVTYTITVSNGALTWTVNQDVIFNILSDGPTIENGISQTDLDLWGTQAITYDVMVGSNNVNNTVTNVTISNIADVSNWIEINKGTGNDWSIKAIRADGTQDTVYNLDVVVHGTYAGNSYALNFNLEVTIKANTTGIPVNRFDVEFF